MVHIKKLEVYGFKSFGFKNTVIALDRGLVAVTGPNGSGKSNILDAIMFAIGENSPKALRVDKFQSLYHDNQNSTHRLIRVSLTFENHDRGIPVDSDSVTLTREMEGQTGESNYYLNGKSVSKTSIVELLEIVLASPNKLNIVQQGMITRISELNSEERRKIIEDIVGLSYFDEKKTEALKQLDDSDRRLEIALAKMGEIRKRIDELELERNDQIRYEQITSELSRFNAIQLSNNIRSIQEKIKTITQILEVNGVRSSELLKQTDELTHEIEKLDIEKTKFIEKADAGNKAKAAVASRIAVLIQDFERTKAMLGQTEERISQIQVKIPIMESDMVAANHKIKELNEQISQKRNVADARTKSIDSLKKELDEINPRLDDLTQKAATRSDLIKKLEERIKKLSAIKNDIYVLAAKIEEKVNTNDYKLSLNKDNSVLLRSELDNSKCLFEELTKSLESGRQKLTTVTKEISDIIKSKEDLQRELSESTALLSRADGITAKFEARAGFVKGSMNEDVAVAHLMKNPKAFGIKGLVHDLLRWNKNYERPILAAGSDWMKAFVVDDIKSMISIAAYAKEKKLPRLRIIPLNVAARSKRAKTPDDDVNIVGNLADFVYSDHDKLGEFLFGDTYVVKNPAAAFKLSRQGWRVVTVEGELFEPAVKSMSLDFGSKISDLTKIVLLGTSVEELRDSLESLKKLIEEKNIQLQSLHSKIISYEAEKVRLELHTSNYSVQIAGEVSKIEEKEKMIQQIELSSSLLRAENENLAVELGKYRRRLSLLVPSETRMMHLLEATTLETASSDLINELNSRKNVILKSIEGASFDINQLMASLAGLDGQAQAVIQKINDASEEKARFAGELLERGNHIETLRTKLQSAETELKKLRDEEQLIIDSSGSSYSVLQEYERKTKSLTENERKLSREVSSIEKESALLRKDLADLSSKQSQLGDELNALGYKEPLEQLNVEMVVKELTDEFQTVKGKINLRADESYVLVIDGYRGMSGRRNQLEEERNSIVSFIDQIVLDKKRVFTDAFKKVDEDIRKTFSEMTTGGSAWLEIENVDDLFSSGILLMVQFPGKPGRESTALSGGEKTIAATVFLLALQSLKPSPFYLLDEIDAHLDAQNTERLSKVLLERAKDNQLIIVTLKDSTVAKASLVYGVYPKEGVSQIIRYRSPTQVPLEQMRTA